MKTISCLLGRRGNDHILAAGGSREPARSHRSATARIGYAKPGDWTEDQIRLVLNANTQGLVWKEISKPGVLE
jgi:hypothetical protein